MNENAKFQPHLLPSTLFTMHIDIIVVTVGDQKNECQHVQYYSFHTQINILNCRHYQNTYTGGEACSTCFWNKQLCNNYWSLRTETLLAVWVRVAESEYVPLSVGFGTTLPPKVLAYNCP